MDERVNGEGLREIVAKTKGWLMFLGILSIIIAFIYLRSSYGILVVKDGFGNYSVLMSVVYILVTLVAFYIGIFLIKVSQSAKRYVRTSNLPELKNYLDGLRKCFKIIAWISVIGIVIVVIVKVVIIVGMTGFYY